MGREYDPELAVLSRHVHLRPPGAAGKRARLWRRPRRRCRGAEPTRDRQQLRGDEGADRQDDRFPQGLEGDQLDGREDAQVTITQGGQPRNFPAPKSISITSQCRTSISIRRLPTTFSAVSGSRSASATSWARCRHSVGSHYRGGGHRLSQSSLQDAPRPIRCRPPGERAANAPGRARAARMYTTLIRDQPRTVRDAL